MNPNISSGVHSVFVLRRALQQMLSTLLSRWQRDVTACYLKKKKRSRQNHGNENLIHHTQCGWTWLQHRWILQSSLRTDVLPPLPGEPRSRPVAKKKPVSDLLRKGGSRSIGAHSKFPPFSLSVSLSRSPLLPLTVANRFHPHPSLRLWE